MNKHDLETALILGNSYTKNMSSNNLRKMSNQIKGLKKLEIQ